MLKGGKKKLYFESQGSTADTWVAFDGANTNCSYWNTTKIWKGKEVILTHVSWIAFKTALANVNVLRCLFPKEKRKKTLNLHHGPVDGRGGNQKLGMQG